MKNENAETIKKIIADHPYKVFTDQEFSLLWHKIHTIHGFKSLSKSKLITRLSEYKIINVIFMSDREKNNYPVYGILDKKPDIFDYAAARSRVSFFTHYTALFIHNLTLQIPKHIYLTFERNQRPNQNNILNQESIDKAFNQPPRHTNNSRSCNNYMIHLVIGQSNNRLGLIPFRKNIFVTDIERTLIDVVARPFYAGGVTQVIEAFKNAREKVNIKKLLSYYKKMNFIYPYHQSIGFYMEKAGYKKKDFILFAEMEQKFKFYLSYNIRFKEFSPHWNLYYPKGL